MIVPLSLGTRRLFNGRLARTGWFFSPCSKQAIRNEYIHAVKSLVPLEIRVTSQQEQIMAVAKVTEIIASSTKGFDDAVAQGVKRANKTLKGVKSVWIKDQKALVENGKISEYRVTMKVSFILKG